MTWTWSLLSIVLVLALPEAHGFEYIGCYADALDRDLAIYNYGGSVTAAICNKICSERGAMYFGLQFTNQCFCGNSYGKYGVKPNNECNMHCSGQPSETCGGVWRNSVYKSDYGINRGIMEEMYHKAVSVVDQTKPNDAHCVPGNWFWCLILGLRHVSMGERFDNVPADNINSILGVYPPNAQSKIASLRWGGNARTVFEDFKFEIKNFEAIGSIHFGIAERVNNHIYVVMVHREPIYLLKPLPSYSNADLLKIHDAIRLDIYRSFVTNLKQMTSY